MTFPMHFEVNEGFEDVGGGDEYEDVIDATGKEGEGEGETWAPSRDEWERMTQFQQTALPVLEQLGSVLQTPLDDEAVYGPQQGQQEEQFDPFDPESVQNYIASSIERGIGDALGPFQGILGTVAAREGETLAKGELDRIAESIGAFDKDTAFLVASGLIEQGFEPAVALERSAGYSRDFEQRIRADERERFKAELKELAGAPQEASTNGTAVEGLPVPTGQDRYRVAVERALGTRNPAIPAG